MLHLSASQRMRAALPRTVLPLLPLPRRSRWVEVTLSSKSPASLRSNPQMQPSSNAGQQGEGTRTNLSRQHIHDIAANCPAGWMDRQYSQHSHQHETCVQKWEFGNKRYCTYSALHKLKRVQLNICNIYGTSDASHTERGYCRPHTYEP